MYSTILKPRYLWAQMWLYDKKENEYLWVLIRNFLSA